MNCKTVRGRLAIAASVLAIALCGCAGEPKRVPVRGVVKLDGKPVDHVLVSFIWADRVSDPAKAGFGAGTSVADGTVEIKDMMGREGMWPGRYKVTFEKYITANGEPLPMNSKQESDVYGSGGKGGARNVLPKRYRNPDTTDVVVEVKDTGLDTVFELRSK